MPEPLRQLFESYRAGWDAFSGPKIASHYRLPATILDMDGLRTYTDEAELADKFQSNCALYRELGYSEAAFEVGSFIANGEEAATVDLAWQVALDAGPLDFRTTYMCARVDGRWCIVSAIAYTQAPPESAAGEAKADGPG